MTNMQNYMEDLQDVLEGLPAEMDKRFRRISKWDAQIKELQIESGKLEDFILNSNKSNERRFEKAMQLAEVRNKIRHLSERKISLAERNAKLIQSIYKKITETAYRCKCEVEIDNPGSTEMRERLFCQIVGSARLEADHADGTIQINSLAPNGRRKREVSVLTEDSMSTRSNTPVPKERKRVGRPRNVLKENSCNNKDALSSARSSMERDSINGRKEETLSKYMRKKQEKLREQQRIEQEMKMRRLEKSGEMTIAGDLNIKNERMSGDNYGGYMADADAQDDGVLDLLDAFPPGIQDLAVPSDILETLEEADVFSMGFGDEPNDEAKIFESPDKSTKKDYTNSSMNSSYSDQVEKRKKNVLFSSIADTSFSGRPRKLTDRVSEMVQMNREREERRKVKEDNEDWCICDGNVNSQMMVRCDNFPCRIGWFHFECVGLTSEPKNEWYCSSCLKIPQHLRVPHPRED